MKQEAVVMSCNCKHDYQDNKYGNKQRVFNTFKDKSGGTHGRCTVCSITKQVRM